MNEAEAEKLLKDKKDVETLSQKYVARLSKNPTDYQLKDIFNELEQEKDTVQNVVLSKLPLVPSLVATLSELRAEGIIPNLIKSCEGDLRRGVISGKRKVILDCYDEHFAEAVQKHFQDKGFQSHLQGDYTKVEVIIR